MPNARNTYCSSVSCSTGARSNRDAGPQVVVGNVETQDEFNSVAASCVETAATSVRCQRRSPIGRTHSRTSRQPPSQAVVTWRWQTLQPLRRDYTGSAAHHRPPHEASPGHVDITLGALFEAQRRFACAEFERPGDNSHAGRPFGRGGDAVSASVGHVADRFGLVRPRPTFPGRTQQGRLEGATLRRRVVQRLRRAGPHHGIDARSDVQVRTTSVPAGLGGAAVASPSGAG